MKARTVLSDENAPAMPAVFADKAEAKYDEAIRAEWDSCMEQTDDGPYPGAAQDRIRQALGAECSRWELTCHDVEIRHRNRHRKVANPRLAFSAVAPAG
jgi:hypothetical protein